MEVTPRRRESRRHRSKTERSWASQTPPSSAESEAPSWGQLPPQRRRRLVAVLGELVLRARGEESRNEANLRQGEADRDGTAQ
jgi:hypothetical protein